MQQANFQFKEGNNKNPSVWLKLKFCYAQIFFISLFFVFIIPFILWAILI